MSQFRTFEVIESVDQYASVWKVLAGDRAEPDLTDRPGLSISWADNPFAFWNAVFLTEHHVDADRLGARMASASAFMRAKRHAGLVYVCEEYLTGEAKERLPAIASQCGLEFALPVTGMVGDFLPVAAPSHPALRFSRVTDEAALQAYADLNAEGYGMALEAVRAGLKGSHFWKHDVHAYLGIENDIPVSAAAAFAHEERLYLALVATKPSGQRKGYAEATVRKALHEACRATGLKRTILHATDAGFPVYRRIGYRKAAVFLAYRLTEVGGPNC
jgi:GNAT superfamily N-acetyltransferase